MLIQASVTQNQCFRSSCLGCKPSLQLTFWIYKWQQLLYFGFFFYMFKDKTNIYTTIFRLNGYLFEGSISNSHLINLLSKACFEHLVCFIRPSSLERFHPVSGSPLFQISHQQ